MASGHGRPEATQRGRGASSNRDGRFEPRQTHAFDDGWQSLERMLDEDGRTRTRVQPEYPRSILARNDSPDIPFSVSINPYKGCEHGCIYCFARPTHAYLGLSPGLDFETRIFSKPNAAELLRAAFAKRGYRPDVIALGANTDPYQPAERELRITRSLLEVMLEHRHPCSVVTKSQGILRDVDLLVQLAELRLVRVFVSITTLDDELARSMEPRASAPAARLRTLRELSQAGVEVGVLASPMVPSLNDVELEAILKASAEAGARTAGWILLRLTQEVAELFQEWLSAHYPQRKEHVLSLLRQAHGGELYRGEFGTRMRGTGPWATLLARRFELAVKRLGLDGVLPPLRCDLFRRPPQPGENLELF